MNVPVSPPELPADLDPAETQDWLDSLAAVAREAGQDRAQFLLRQLEDQSRQLGIVGNVQPFSAYRNSIPLERQGAYPGNLAMEERITAIHRWNALAMVMRGNAAYGDLGGHVASYASAAEIFETGFNHFFKAGPAGDLVYFQPPIRRRASMPAPSSKAGSTSPRSQPTARSSAATACAPIRTPG